MNRHHPLFEIVTTTAGAVSIRNKELNEIMHNPVGPWVEANALYIEPSELLQRLQSPAEKPLVIFDVGLGAAANALAALHCFDSLKDPRELILVSFEKDLELLRFALEHAEQFSHFERFIPAMEVLLREKKWQGQGLTWFLREGDFLETIDQEPYQADLIFYDPYSKNVNSEMWTVECFMKLRQRSKSDSEGGCLFLNYSRATPVRTALLLAGYFVGQGPQTGLKDETTQAATKLTDLARPLEKAWLQRWKRSHTPLPVGFSSEQITEVEQRLLSHPQFR